MPASDAPRLLSPDAVLALRGARRTLERVVPCRHSAEQLWPYLTQIDSFNRASGSSPVEYEFIPTAGSASVIRATSRKIGLTMRYQELPYEWIQPRFVHGELFFENGPFRYGRIRAEYLEEQSAVRYTVDYVPRHRIGFAPLLARAILGRFASIIRSIDQRLPESVHDPLGAAGFADQSAAAIGRGAALARRWAHLATDALLPEALAGYVATAPDRLVSRMRPYAVAEQLGTSRRETLQFCLRASRERLLELRWDLVCPSCGGAKRRAATLAELGQEAHCDVCNIRYDADIQRNVEISFRPPPDVRRIDEREFCIQSPSDQRRILAQINLEPGATLRLPLSLQPGHYRLRCISREGEALFDSAYGRRQVERRVGVGDRIEATAVDCGSELVLILENDSAEWRTIRFEHHGYRQDAAVAAEIVELPEFRESFGDDVATALPLSTPVAQRADV